MLTKICFYFVLLIFFFVYIDLNSYSFRFQVRRFSAITELPFNFLLRFYKYKCHLTFLNIDGTKYYKDYYCFTTFDFRKKLIKKINLEIKQYHFDFFSKGYYPNLQICFSKIPLNDFIVIDDLSGLSCYDCFEVTDFATDSIVVVGISKGMPLYYKLDVFDNTNKCVT